MVHENCRVASEVCEHEFTQTDYDMIEAVKQEINANTKVGCTGCGYCMPCPKGIDIPAAFRCYNRMYTETHWSGRFEYHQIIALQKDMADIKKCIECGKCESHCPQHIEIRKQLKEARKHLQPWYYRWVVKVARLFKFW